MEVAEADKTDMDDSIKWKHIRVSLKNEKARTNQDKSIIIIT